MGKGNEVFHGGNMRGSRHMYAHVSCHLFHAAMQDVGGGGWKRIWVAGNPLGHCFLFFGHKVNNNNNNTVIMLTLTG